MENQNKFIDFLINNEIDLYNLDSTQTEQIIKELSSGLSVLELALLKKLYTVTFSDAKDSLAALKILLQYTEKNKKVIKADDAFILQVINQELLPIDETQINVENEYDEYNGYDEYEEYD